MKDEARAERLCEEFESTIAKAFNAASGGAIAFVALGSNDGDYSIEVRLNRKLTRAEKKHLPAEYDGIGVNYEVHKPPQFEPLKPRF